MGFVLLGLMAGVVNNSAQPEVMANAYGSAMFYVVTYVLTTLVSFGVILLLAREGFESEEIADFAGLNQRSPLYAGIMAVCLFSLTGVPPLVGFQARLSGLEAPIGAGQPTHIALAVFAVLMSLVGAFYYLRVIKVMYFDDQVGAAGPVSAPLDMRALLTLNGALLLILGIVPGTLMTLCENAIRQMLAT
jgi:NADH-quinone oxidoreductase subunit N